MASKHILSLGIPESANCSVLSIIDTSVYSSSVPVECEELLITPPGFAHPTLIEVTQGFNLPVTGCAIGLQTTSCNTTINTMPDGIYIIKYSVSPNDKVYVEYNHLRVTELLSTYYRKLCELDITPCGPSSERKNTLNEMYYIRTLIDAAKAKVEFCQSPNEGMELYEFAKKKLKKITCSVCC
uniref:Uncharacterized protein n=1 Tax=Virus NIOZ-UU157 TaxID=2763269 RepID=A0A7S9SU64_9VIRU|nr:MAG: hypothetical protein NIOZUU157_00230 [Virus NIOZ-UU157]|tara:strand:- start:1306 stop:1854 length:549 start_codon:yes stop_codon:yes gene_type:complete